MNDELKIARLNARTKSLEYARDILTNPAIIAIAGVILVEYLQSHTETYTTRDGQTATRRVAGGGYVGTVAGTALETGLITFAAKDTIKAFAEQQTEISKAIAPIVGMVGSMALKGL